MVSVFHSTLVKRLINNWRLLQTILFLNETERFTERYCILTMKVLNSIDSISVVVLNQAKPLSLPSDFKRKLYPLCWPAWVHLIRLGIYFISNKSPSYNVCLTHGARFKIRFRCEMGLWPRRFHNALNNNCEKLRLVTSSINRCIGQLITQSQLICGIVVVVIQMNFDKT